MIKLTDDWVIMIDDMNYTLAKCTGERYDKKQKKSVPAYAYKGYFGSLEQALNCFGREKHKERLKGGCMTLAEAVQAIRESNNEVKQLLSEVIDMTRLTT